MYTDRSLSCADCGQEFSFTAGEQEFYAQRGFTEAPRRCPSCRQIRKAQRSRSDSSDGYGSRADSGGNGGYSGGRSSSSFGEQRPREMFEATCANCGNTASVPFRPSGAKPVYCSDCFEGRR